MEIGKEFEQMVAELYRRMGYDVETNKIVEGVSKVVHEIDVYGEKKSVLGKQTVFVECKYRNNETVGKGDLANFLLTLDDTRVGEGHVVSNTVFSEDARIIADSYNIKLVDGEELGKLLEEYGMECHFNDLEYNQNINRDPIVYVVRSVVGFLDEVGFFKKALGR